jgi:hypothetical protein
MIEYHNKMEVERYHQAVTNSSRGETDDTVGDDVPRFVPCFSTDVSDASSEPAPEPAREEPTPSRPLSSSPSNDAEEDCVVGPWYERDVKVEASTKGGQSQTLTISIRRRKLRFEPDKIYESAASIASFNDLIYESASEKSEPIGQASTQRVSSPCMEPKPSCLALQGSKETFGEDEEGGGWVTDNCQNCSELSAADNGDIDDVDRLAAMFGIVSHDTESQIESSSPTPDAGHASMSGSTSAAAECSDVAEVHGGHDSTPADLTCILSHVTPERRLRKREHRRGPRQAPKRGPVARSSLAQQTTAVRLVQPEDLEA